MYTANCYSSYKIIIVILLHAVCYIYHLFNKSYNLMYMVCPIVGYLTEEGLHRTCASFREECSLFHNGNNNLDQVH